MRPMVETAAPGRAGICAQMSAWIGRRQRQLSNRVHAAGDECARQHGWEITKSTGRFGFGTRTYRDPRFDRRQQLSVGTRAAEANGNRSEPVGRRPGTQAGE